MEMTPDNLDQVVAGKLIKPLNLDYIPNLKKNVWPQLVSPFYDSESRYTVPYKVNTRYWTRAGGASADDWQGTYTMAMPASIASSNAYVVAWQCRGHYFAGSRSPEEGDVQRRYLRSCP